MSAYGAPLNAILGLIAIIAEVQLENPSYGVVQYVIATVVMGTLPTILWFAAGAIVPHPRPFVTAVLPALLIVIAGAVIGDVSGAYIGILLDGLGPLIGSAIVISRRAPTPPRFFTA